MRYMNQGTWNTFIQEGHLFDAVVVNSACVSCLYLPDLIPELCLTISMFSQEVQYIAYNTVHVLPASHQEEERLGHQQGFRKHCDNVSVKTYIRI